MRISVNLATRPFVELRPLFARLRLAMAVLAVLAVGLGFWLHALTQRASAAAAQMDALKARTAAFQSERQANEARMRQPQNMAVLERSRFLNDVFAHKSFSWTAVMMDLERVLPVGVQVTSIDPVITKEGDVNIRLRVSGDRDRAVQLVRNLETSERFVAPRLGGETAQTGQTGQGSPAGGTLLATAPASVVFEIFSGYNPLPERGRGIPAVEVRRHGGLLAEGAPTPSRTTRRRSLMTGPRSGTQPALRPIPWPATQSGTQRTPGPDSPPATPKRNEGAR